MINTKELYNTLLNNESITSLVGEDNILNAYPESIENFPTIIFLDENQNDIEYADNVSHAVNCSVQIHIFSKKIDSYPSTSEIGIAVADVMNKDWWNCNMNGETPDPVDEVEHRVMRFSKSILC